jgi:hypothetical protein
MLEMSIPKEQGNVILTPGFYPRPSTEGSKGSTENRTALACSYPKMKASASLAARALYHSLRR